MYLNFVEKHKHMEVHVEITFWIWGRFPCQRSMQRATTFFCFCGTEGNHRESLENNNLLRMLEQWFWKDGASIFFYPVTKVANCKRRCVWRLHSCNPAQREYHLGKKSRTGTCNFCGLGVIIMELESLLWKCKCFAPPPPLIYVFTIVIFFFSRKKVCLLQLLLYVSV